MTEPKRNLIKALLRVAQGVVTAFANFFREEHGIEADGVKKNLT